MLPGSVPQGRRERALRTATHVKKKGLTQVEAAERRAQYGPNSLPEAPPTPIWRRFLKQFRSPLIYILLFALALNLGIWVSEGAQEIPFESIAIASILLLNSGLGAFQEMKAEAALARLRVLAAPTVWVFRDGHPVRLPSADLVPGDVIRLEAGDRVPADGRLAESYGVMLDESVLTGESVPVEKEEGEEALSGTLLVRGKAFIEIERIGPCSAMGRLATMIGGIEASKTPLERRLEHFGHQVAYVIVALAVALTLGGLVAEGPERLGHVVLFSVALAVAAIPEGLPAVLTLTLALGVQRMSSRNAIVRRLSSVEALGSVTVIATDKTGTLTENRMHVHAIDAPDERRALQAMLLVNDADLVTRAGDPLELALLDFASTKDGASVAAARASRISARPFDSLAKFMRVTVEDGGRQTSYLKGAPEVLIARSHLSADERQLWQEKAYRHASEGFRVLALAGKEGESEEDLDFLGLVMLWDPPRAEVPDAMAKAQAAGIRVVMITGDHPATAAAVGRAVGITGGRTLAGPDIEAMSDNALCEAAKVTSVFARVSPEHKMRIVEALKAGGEVVAVTGDGVNDAPALKRADVGIAMGQRGSDVSREVADLVLTDDNFATIVAAIEEGRSIYENIQKVIRLLLSTNFALVLPVVMGLGVSFLLGIKDPITGTFLLPLTAVQLLWINVIADGPPALALTFDSNPGLMRQRPRSPASPLLDWPSFEFIIVTGLAKGLGGVALLVLMPWWGYGFEATRTVVFLYESFAQLVFAYPVRHVTVEPRRNAILHLTVAASVALQLATVLLAPLRALLGLVPVDVTAWLMIAIAVLASWAAAELVSRAIALHVRRANGAGLCKVGAA